MWLKIKLNNLNQEASAAFELSQNYPNPFNPLTNINYSIPNNGMVQLTIYNIIGKEIVTLINEYRSAETYQVQLDGSKLPSGIYFYKLRTQKQTLIRKMFLLK